MKTDSSEIDMTLEEGSTERASEETDEIGDRADMVRVFPGKMTSGNSSSSEKTPLLNGSHEGPTYAYSYSQEEYEEENDRDSSSPSFRDLTKEKLIHIVKSLKFIVLIAIILFSVISLNFIKVSDGKWKSISLTRGVPTRMNVTSDVTSKREIIHLRVKGPFLPGEYYSITGDFVSFTVFKIHENGTHEIISPTWTVLLAPETQELHIISLEHEFNLASDDSSQSKAYQLSVATNKLEGVSIDYTIEPKLSGVKVIMAVCILIGLYILIIFDVVHRTVAAMIAATTSVSCLTLIGQKPSFEEVLTWTNVDVLCLLFGTMVLVSVLCETGFFDLAAVLAYKVSCGHNWALITSLCLVTALLSVILDSRVAVLLMSALTVRLSEAMNIDPKQLFIGLVMFSNIGSASHLKETTEISNFQLHIFPAIILSFATCYIFWRIMRRDLSVLRFKEPLEVIEVEREREVWKKLLSFLSNYSKDEESVRAILRRKVSALDTLLRKRLYDSKISEEDYKTSLKELTLSMKVERRTFLIESIVVLGLVLLLLLLGHIPHLDINPGWIGILCSLLILCRYNELESLISRVEWSTLLFLGAIFVLSEAMLQLDLVWYLVYATKDLITATENSSLLVGLIVIIWISAFSSNFILPFTSIMIQVLKGCDNENFKPFMLALYLGASLGGNGTLIASSVNVTVAGVSEQHGHRFSFWDFFRIGFPTALLTTTLSMVYLLICHAWIGWND